MAGELSLLLVLPQFPLDSGSGAARSLTTISEMVAGAGHRVRALATTASELAHHINVFDSLAEQGIRVSRTRESGERPELTFQNRSIVYRLLDTGTARFDAWQKLHNRQFDLMFDQELARFRPDIVLTFGGTPDDVRRRKRARRQGVKVVFGLRNFGYLTPGGLEETDAILAASPVPG